MNKDPDTKSTIRENPLGLGEVTEEMVEERAKELALIAGRRLTNAYREEAFAELTGHFDPDQKTALLESFSEDERWNPVRGSVGHRTEEPAEEGEDDDGLDENAQFYQEGVSEAEHDQMFEAAREAKERDHFEQ